MTAIRALIIFMWTIKNIKEFTPEATEMVCNTSAYSPSSIKTPLYHSLVSTYPNDTYTTLINQSRGRVPCILLHVN